MKVLFASIALLIASAGVSFAHDYDTWYGDPAPYVVERRVTVETFVHRYEAPAYSRRTYVEEPEEAYEAAADDLDDVPARRSYGAVHVREDQDCIVKRRWRHGHLVEKIRCW